ncbi:MAG: response regulator [Patescibacteria group bacterium]|nr:response regulator [Patescibacteria group bacterium]
MGYDKTILHVDDDPITTQMVALQLRPLGYDVTSLNDPTQTLWMLSQSHYRLIILDIDMPQVNGLDLLRQIKHTDGGTQVIMLTGLLSTQTLLQSYRWGAEFCIFKPLTSITPLAEAIEMVFHKIEHWWNALEELSRQRHATRDTAERSLPPMSSETSGQIAIAPTLSHR